MFIHFTNVNTHRYEDQALAAGYNATHHRSIQMQPRHVCQSIIRQFLQGTSEKTTLVKFINITLAHGYVLVSSGRPFLKVIYLAGVKSFLSCVTVECNVSLCTTYVISTVVGKSKGAIHEVRTISRVCGGYHQSVFFCTGVGDGRSNSVCTLLKKMNYEYIDN